MREGLSFAPVPEGVREGTEVMWVEEDWLKMYYRSRSSRFGQIKGVVGESLVRLT